MIERTEFEAQQHLEQLFDQFEEETSGFGKLVAKYNGEPLGGSPKPYYDRITDHQVCPVDPDAVPMHPSGEAVRSWDTVITIFEERGIKAYLATPDLSQRTHYYPARLFYYDPENGWYFCPQNSYTKPPWKIPGRSL